MIQETDRRILNYVVVGDRRSGTSVVQTSLCNRPGAICHGFLLDANEDVRRHAHEDYFGACKNPLRMPEWFVERNNSPWQYINHSVLDNPKHGETAVGFRLFYAELQRWELYDLLQHRCREGDFCVVHVRRNPLACFISFKQAQQTGLWFNTFGGAVRTYSPCPIALDAAELTAFCRQHEAIAGKIARFCDDILEVQYRDLFVNYQDVMRKVFDFLELPDIADPAVPGCRRLRNSVISRRVSNWDKVCKDVPSDVRQLFGADDLF